MGAFENSSLKQNNLRNKLLTWLKNEPSMKGFKKTQDFNKLLTMVIFFHTLWLDCPTICALNARNPILEDLKIVRTIINKTSSLTLRS